MILRACAHTALFTLAIACGAAAQTLPTGTWTGTMLPPEGREAPVTYEVTTEGGAIGIVMTVEGTAPRPLEDVRVDDESIRFAFQLGVPLECVLERAADDSYRGNCSGGGTTGRLTMVPPSG